jgi:hypothetical protein
MRDDTGSTQQPERTGAGVAVATFHVHELPKYLDALFGCADRLVRLVPKLSHLRTLVCVLVVSGCAGSAPQVETRSEPVRSPAQMCRIDHALLTPVHAPDCGFGRADLKTVDPEQWTHLKLEFERKCYQNAEKIARERLRRLQAAAKCEVQTAQR